MKKSLKKISLSIVILNRNTQEFLRQCLASLPKKDDYQIIVVDNGSTDNSVAMVKEEFPKVELILSSTNLGFTRGNNLAKNTSCGEYILFLNSDTKVYSKTLETMVEFMGSDQKIGISTCISLLPDGKLYYGCHRGFPTPWNSLCYFLGLPSNYNGSFWPIDKIHEIDACSGSFLMIQKNLLDKIGWFDEDYYAYGEDLEMCYRVKELGYKVMFNPTVKIIHFWRSSKGTKQWNNARSQAMKIFYDKHYRQKYPKLFRRLVFFGIDLANFFRRGRD